MLLAGRPPLMLDGDAPLVSVAVQLQDGQETAGATTAFCWQRGPLTVLVRVGSVGSAAAALELAAVLDDRSAAVAHLGFEEGWRDWLRLGNGLQRHTIPVEVTTRRLLETEGSTPSGTQSRPTLSGVWRSAWDAMLDDQGRLLVETLAYAHVAPPSRVGEELGEAAVPAELIWDGPRVAVLIDFSDQDVNDLRSEGWTVVEAEAGAVLSALGGSAGPT